MAKTKGKAPESPGARLKAARLASGKGPEELARALDIARQSYLQYESGRRRPTLEQLHRFAVAIGCDPNSLDDRLSSDGGK